MISKIKSINPKSSNSLETDIQYLLESQGYAIRQYSKENTEPKTYEIISQAILEQKKLQFDYTNSNGYKFQATIHPYGIQYWEKNYLVGFDEYSKKKKKVFKAG
ncbi:MAG: WYL domain-containing protein [Candidatus Melainabacteria bacterium]|nr:MAG: WYL domain-containing protein [Candidatus Melainabacteria bacterium]